ncbi:hypothetical protein Dsin_002274 [Dipteronia sinensis]|uniref:FAR1 domain-containing protein n=1 Tax=Dipteronia sinensis TaxID=43782 RepID=A0AAE0EJ43_9ROSI|nr:hypothetical protein Dsin_002274 [Dipteronia sinensis]
MDNTNSKLGQGCRQDRVGCKARFAISLDCDMNKYNVRAFEDTHCHKLATFCEVAWVRFHRNIDDKNFSQIDAMGKSCVRPCLAYEYMVEQNGATTKFDSQRKTCST